MKSQKRERVEDMDYRILIEDTDYRVLYKDEHIVVGVNGHYQGEWPVRMEATLLNKEGKMELWMESDDYAEHVIVIEGVGFEFIRTLEEDE